MAIVFNYNAMKLLHQLFIQPIRAEYKGHCSTMATLLFLYNGKAIVSYQGVVKSIVPIVPFENMCKSDVFNDFFYAFSVDIQFFSHFYSM